MMSGRSLSMALQRQDVAINRLSSGYRINSAKDDAAGLQISNRLLAQESGLAVAMRNANNGISIGQVAEGALKGSVDILQRMRELALQSANGVYTNSDRNALDGEYQSLIKEIDRISNSTSFGSMKLLDGTFLSKSFQVGSNANEIIPLSIPSLNSKNIGLHTFSQVPVLAPSTIDISTTFLNTVVAGTISEPSQRSSFQTLMGNTTGIINTTTANGTTSLRATDYSSSKEFSQAINTLDSGLTAETVTNAFFNFDYAPSGPYSPPLEMSFELKCKDQTPVSITHSFTDLNDSSEINSFIDKINSHTGTTNVVASTASLGVIELVNEDGDNIRINNFNLTDIPSGRLDIKLGSRHSSGFEGTTMLAGYQHLYTTHQADGSVLAVPTHNPYMLVNGWVKVYDENGDDVSNSTLNREFPTGEYTGELIDNGLQSSIFDSNISTQDASQAAIDVIDGAIKQIDGQRASIGAFQNRLSSTISNLANIKENISTSISRIKDTDFAKETASLTKAKIISEAGTAILAQANKIPQNILKLLE
jgi:flagellin